MEGRGRPSVRGLAEGCVKNHWPTRTHALVLFGMCSLAAVLLRALLIPSFLPVPKDGDAPGYLGRAAQLLRGEVMGSPDEIAVRGPSYPLFIATIYLVAPRRPESVLLVQALLVVATAWLGMNLARRHGAGEVRALAVGVGILLYPPFVYWSVQVLSETLYVFLVILGMHLADGVYHRPRLRDAVTAGVAMGTAVLCRPIALVYVPVMAGVLFVADGPRRKRLAWAGAAVVAVALLLGAWAWRNYRWLGVPIVTTSHSGSVFYIGNSAEFLADPRVGSGVFFGNEELRSKVSALGEVAGDRYLFERAKAFLLEDPMRAARLLLTKLAFFLRPFPEAPPLERWIAFASVVAALAFAASAWWPGRPCPVWFACALMIGLTVVVHTVFLPAGRFRLPAEILLLVMGALIGRRPPVEQPAGAVQRPE